MAKVSPITNFFTKIASSKAGQKFYNKALNPKKDSFWDATMPMIETSVASLCYIGSTAVQKDIDDRSKKALQIQNVLSWVISLGISMPLNKRLLKFTKNIEKGLKPELMEDFHKVSKGLAIIAPLTFVTVLNRALIPSVLVPISSVIRDRHDKRKQLDMKA